MAETTNDKIEEMYQTMADNWPFPFVLRGAAEKFSGYTVSAKTLQLYDSRGEGPDGRIYIGGRVAYPKDSLARWLRNRTRPTEEKK